jgi:hypothetical protein
MTKLATEIANPANQWHCCISAVLCRLCRNFFSLQPGKKVSV